MEACRTKLTCARPEIRKNEISRHQKIKIPVAGTKSDGKRKGENDYI